MGCDVDVYWSLLVRWADRMRGYCQQAILRASRSLDPGYFRTRAAKRCKLVSWEIPTCVEAVEDGDFLLVWGVF